MWFENDRCCRFEPIMFSVRYTYGDFCTNPRARALLSATRNDVLLFWALLWRIEKARADVLHLVDGVGI
jgi:hypothetical protein